MPGRIEHTAERAHHLVQTGDVVAAHGLLREALATVEPDPASASPSLATAAMLYARVLVALGESSAARRWAAYAHAASRRLYGDRDERTLQAASVLAGVLYRAGAYSRSAHLYRELISQLSPVDDAQALAAQADLATVLHARGDCADARRLLEQAWQAYRHRFGADHPLGLRMLARLGVMERSCGLPERARQRFAQAEALCRRHLPTGHRLAAQIGRLSQAPPDRRHACGEPLALAAAEPPGPTAAATEPPTPTEASAAEPTTDAEPTADAEPTGRHRTGQALTAGLAVAIITVAVIAAGSLIARAGSTSDNTVAGPEPSSAPAAPSDAARSPAPSAAATSPPAAVATGPPTAVTLTDTRTALILAWRYPRGAHGSVVLTAGRPGQPRHTFQTLPAGSTHFTVYGLAPGSNYCFGVGVMYSASVVKTAPPVCTSR